MPKKNLFLFIVVSALIFGGWWWWQFHWLERPKPADESADKNKPTTEAAKEIKPVTNRRTRPRPSRQPERQLSEREQHEILGRLTPLALIPHGGLPEWVRFDLCLHDLALASALKLRTDVTEIAKDLPPIQLGD